MVNWLERIKTTFESADLTLSFVHLFIHSFIHWLSLTHPFTHSLTHSIYHSLSVYYETWFLSDTAFCFPIHSLNLNQPLLIPTTFSQFYHSNVSKTWNYILEQYNFIWYEHAFIISTDQPSQTKFVSNKQGATYRYTTNKLHLLNNSVWMKENVENISQIVPKYRQNQPSHRRPLSVVKELKLEDPFEGI